MEVPQEILSRYLERRKRDLEACLYNLEKKNFSELEKVGHQLKGNASTFGHEDLTSISSELELAAATRDIAQLEFALENFSTWVSEHIN